MPTPWRGCEGASLENLFARILSTCDREGYLPSVLVDYLYIHPQCVCVRVRERERMRAEE